tara:strand:- start:42 stop:425 length:384 start_codon:yes stop_codon:yes gene_type:complete
MLISCEDNESNPETGLPESGAISGNVNFSGTWPDSGDVLITLDTAYPPQGPPAGFAYITSDEVSNGVYSYRFPNLSFRAYEAMTVTYWSLGYSTAGSNYSLIGSFIDTLNVTQDDPELMIDIDVTFD